MRGAYRQPFWSISTGVVGIAKTRSPSPFWTYTNAFSTLPSCTTRSPVGTGPSCCDAHSPKEPKLTVPIAGTAPSTTTWPAMVPVVAWSSGVGVRAAGAAPSSHATASANAASAARDRGIREPYETVGGGSTQVVRICPSPCPPWDRLLFRFERMPQLKVGSDEHKQVFCREFVETHHAYEPEDLRWPDLAPAEVERLRNLPFWGEAIGSERTAAARVR